MLWLKPAGRDMLAGAQDQRSGMSMKSGVLEAQLESRYHKNEQALSSPRVLHRARFPVLGNANLGIGEVELALAHE